VALETIHLDGVKGMTRQAEMPGRFVFTGQGGHMAIDTAHEAVFWIADTQALGLVTLMHQEVHVFPAYQVGRFYALITAGLGE